MTASDPVDYGYEQADDYGYGDGAPDSMKPGEAANEMDYGYGYGDDGAPDAANEMDYGYGYGDGAPDSQPPQPEPHHQQHHHAPAPTPRSNNKKSLSLFVQAHAHDDEDDEDDGGMLAHLQNKGASSPTKGGGKKKKRGRRLSMFAFAGQDEDEEEVIQKEFQQENHHHSHNNNRSHHKRTTTGYNNNISGSSDHSRGGGGGGGGAIRRTLSDESKQNNSSGKGGLGSFFSGGGSGGGSEVDGAAGGGGVKKKGGRRGRRLSMMAFADGAGANEEQVMEDDTPGGMLAHVNLNYASSGGTSSNHSHHANNNSNSHHKRTTPPVSSSNNSVSKHSTSIKSKASNGSSGQQQQPPPPARRGLMRSTSDTGFNRQPSFRRIKTTDVVTNGDEGGSGEESGTDAGGNSKSSNKYANTQLPAEYLQDAQHNKPVTRKMTTGGQSFRGSATARSKVPVTRHSASAYAPRQQQQQQPRVRQQRRSSFGAGGNNNNNNHANNVSSASSRRLRASSPDQLQDPMLNMPPPSPQVPPSPRRFSGSGGGLVNAESLMYKSPSKARANRSRSDVGRNPPPMGLQRGSSTAAVVAPPRAPNLSSPQKASPNDALSRSAHGGRSFRNPSSSSGGHLVSPASRSNQSPSSSAAASPHAPPHHLPNVKMLSGSGNSVGGNSAAYGVSPQKQRNRLTMQNIPENIQPKATLQKSSNHSVTSNKLGGSTHERQSLASLGHQSDHNKDVGGDNGTVVTTATAPLRADVDMKEVDELQQYMAKMDTTTTTTAPGSSAASSSGLSVGSSMSAATNASSAATLYRKEAAAMAREAQAACAAGVEINSHNMSLLYILARCCEWDAVLEELKEFPRDAKVVSEKDGTTALHLAVMSRTNPMMRDGKVGGGVEPAPLSVIEALVRACPEAAIIRCTKKRYTPLCYACLVADPAYDMQDCQQIVQILLKHAPHAPFVFTDDGFSALDIHILSYSQLHKQNKALQNHNAASSTIVLQALLEGEPSLADARVYRNKIRGPLELLYRCNIEEFKEAVEEEQQSSSAELDHHQTHQTQQRFFGGANGAESLSDWWAWKWSLMLLKFASISAGQEVDPFNAVQAAARLVGCPLPILALSISSFPQQVMDRDPTGDIYNLPLHEVCSWRADSENVAGDPFIATRKFKAMRMLLEQFPEAARMTNNCGETPLQLAVETCTPWHGGLEALVESCPKALKFPRKLRITDNGLSLAVANHSAIDSVGTVDSDEPDPLEDMENMYPFLVSAVLGGVSQNKRRPPVSFSDEMAEEHYANLERKSLQAVRAVFGLLRARPEVLEKYRALVRREERAKQQSSSSGDRR